MRIAVTILPAGAAGDAVAGLAVLVAVGLADDLMIDFFETAMEVPHMEFVLLSTTLANASGVPNFRTSLKFPYPYENRTTT
jgi:hypothetical protein